MVTLSKKRSFGQLGGFTALRTKPQHRTAWTKNNRPEQGSDRRSLGMEVMEKANAQDDLHPRKMCLHPHSNELLSPRANTQGFAPSVGGPGEGGTSGRLALARRAGGAQGCVPTSGSPVGGGRKENRCPLPVVRGPRSWIPGPWLQTLVLGPRSRAPDFLVSWSCFPLPSAQPGKARLPLAAKQGGSGARFPTV